MMWLVRLALNRPYTFVVASLLGRDLGNSVEVLSGFTPTDSVIENPSDSLTDGTLVSVQQPRDHRSQ